MTPCSFGSIQRSQTVARLFRWFLGSTPFIRGSFFCSSVSKDQAGTLIVAAVALAASLAE